MHKDQLIKLGLTKTQAAVLDFLLESGEKKAREISRETKQPRGVIYKALTELEELNLIEKIEKQKEITRFRAASPRNLEKIIEKKEVELGQNKKAFEELLPVLTSSYNLSLNKPGVKFYEGKEGLEKVLYDTLTSKTEVYLMFNRTAMLTEPDFIEINKEYRTKRIRAGINKKIIRIGQKPELTFGTKDDKYDAITEIKYLEKTPSPFKTNIHIYDGKISFLIIEQRKIIGILIENKHIYELNKFWFEMLWDLATK